MTRLLATLLGLLLTLLAVPASALAPTPIPDDFPLTWRIAENESGEQPTASADGDGVMELRACDRAAWPLRTGAVSERLAVRATGPEYADARELVVLRNARAAVRLVAAVRRTIRACVDRPDAGRQWTEWTGRAAQTGYDSFTFSLTYSTSLGASAIQVVRVGSGVLVTEASGEGTLGSLRPTIRKQTRVGRHLAASMCEFARAGC
ncbi:hypothetical protein [Nocardioides currus]|nr:hypothetical protein [Nocardioides currus]